MRIFVALGLLLASCAQQPTPMDLGASGAQLHTVPPTNEIRVGSYEGPTPTELAGAQLISTAELSALMRSSNPLLVDVLDGVATSIPGAVLLSGVGEGTGLNDEVQTRFAAKLSALTRGDRSRPIVMFCLSQTCWLSHNAAVRAVAAGYRRLYWYRGGRSAWLEAGLPLVPVAPTSW